MLKSYPILSMFTHETGCQKLIRKLLQHNTLLVLLFDYCCSIFLLYSTVSAPCSADNNLFTYQDPAAARARNFVLRRKPTAIHASIYELMLPHLQCSVLQAVANCCLHIQIISTNFRAWHLCRPDVESFACFHREYSGNRLYQPQLPFWFRTY
jgi:hypothetical protein